MQLAYASAPSYASQEEEEEEKKQRSKNKDNWGNKGSIHPVVPPLHPTNGRWPKCDAATWNIHMYHRIKIHVHDARPSRLRISSPQPWAHIHSSLHNARIRCFWLFFSITSQMEREHGAEEALRHIWGLTPSGEIAQSQHLLRTQKKASSLISFQSI